MEISKLVLYTAVLTTVVASNTSSSIAGMAGYWYIAAKAYPISMQRFPNYPKVVTLLTLPGKWVKSEALPEIGLVALGALALWVFAQMACVGLCKAWPICKIYFEELEAKGD